ncbi:MAG: Spy/CpxP family protein refolding chaperone [Muribaculaceae bacterium]|nr:Spy/CpxP family protein refolding chaperone [Muribaculaceae bacterium]
MKKTILGISFLLMAAFAGSANAQCPNEANCPDPENCKKEQCDKKDCKVPDCKKNECADCSQDKQDCRRRDYKGPRPGHHDMAAAEARQAALFEGLNLTSEQQQKITDLDKALKASRQELKDKAKEDKNARSRSAMMENEKALRVKYLADLNNILSAEQYTQFLQNFYVNQAPVNPNMLKAGAQRFERRLDVEKKMGEQKFDQDKAELRKDAKNFEKKVEKDVKKGEKKMDKKKK